MSLDAVAERAGLSKGRLLYNFGNKSVWLQAMVTRHVDVLQEAVELPSAEIAKDGRPNARIRGLSIRSAQSALRQGQCAVGVPGGNCGGAGVARSRACAQ
ncbi:MAG: TetR/AcrR family transcriptional regulator [Breoghania sp.]|nr:TetR/AcrR family transcriptional regulator [Breoghania sp.]